MSHRDAVETYEQDGLTAYLYQDSDASNPREDVDNFGRMVCCHRNYKLSDEPDCLYNGKKHTETFDEPSDFQAWWEENGKGGAILPLYLYDHSGITMSTGSFGDVWDSGQVGYIYATRRMILENWNRKHVTKKLREQADALLKAEVETYDQYLTGDVYGYQIEDGDGKHLDSCWGFFGHKYAEEEAKARLADAVTNAKIEHTAALSREADASGDVPMQTEVA